MSSKDNTPQTTHEADTSGQSQTPEPAAESGRKLNRENRAAWIAAVAAIAAAIITGIFALLDPDIVVNVINGDVVTETTTIASAPTTTTEPAILARFSASPTPTTTDTTPQPTTSPEPTTDDATPPPTVTPCSGITCGLDVPFDLNFYVSENSLYLHLLDGEADGPSRFDLSQLWFEFISEGERQQLSLAEQFPMLLDSPIRAPVCLLLARPQDEDEATILTPSACEGITLAAATLSEPDVFWFNGATGELRAFLLRVGESPVDFCGTSANGICRLTVDSPPEPAQSPVTLALDWGRDYLAIYIEDDAGVVNLEGLVITEDPDNPRLLEAVDTFENLRFAALITPICFYIRTGDTVRAPDGCDTGRRIIKTVVPDDAFWYRLGNKRPLFVSLESVGVDELCGNMTRCEIGLPTP